MTDMELVGMALSICAATGHTAEAVKKAVFHEHGVDWSHVWNLATVLRADAERLCSMAEREIAQEDHLGIEILEK